MRYISFRKVPFRQEFHNRLLNADEPGAVLNAGTHTQTRSNVAGNLLGVAACLVLSGVFPLPCKEGAETLNLPGCISTSLFKCLI